MDMKKGVDGRHVDGNDCGDEPKIEKNNKQLVDTKNAVGARLKECRKWAGKKQREVAHELGMVVQQYQKFESGQFELNYERIIIVCKFLDISADYLLGIDDPTTLFHGKK